MLDNFARSDSIVRTDALERNVLEGAYMLDLLAWNQRLGYVIRIQRNHAMN